MTEREFGVAGRIIMVRDAGDPDGRPLLHFHGTPGSRPDVNFGDELSGDMGVRMISFDRPGYGRSELGPYSLGSVARDAAAVADCLRVDRFATLGGPVAARSRWLLRRRWARCALWLHGRRPS